MDIGYSVLMSVYVKESPDFLRQSMESIYDQTIPTDDFVLICDGPLNEGLDAVIDEMQNKFGPRLRVFRQSENHGLGYCLNLGVKECKHDLIARMDSDDVSVKDRCERELKVFKEHPEFSVVGGFVGDFKNDINKIESIRKVPETNEKIIKFCKIRSPFNHPSVMYKKQDVLEVGSYQDVRFCQDYYLWVELLATGHKGYNIQDILVYMREDKNSFKRRSGKKYFKIQKRLLKRMRELEFISPIQYAESVSVRYCSAFAPNWLRKFMFSRLMRKGIK